MQSTASGESDAVGDGPLTPVANRADADQAVPLFVHVHAYVHVHVQNGICTRLR